MPKCSSPGLTFPICHKGTMMPRGIFCSKVSKSPGSLVSLAQDVTAIWGALTHYALDACLDAPSLGCHRLGMRPRSSAFLKILPGVNTDTIEDTGEYLGLNLDLIMMTMREQELA